MRRRALSFVLSSALRAVGRATRSGGHVGCAVAIGLRMSAHEASADAPDGAADAERFATRLSIPLLGESAAPALRSAVDPQAQVAELLKSPSFRERFARF